jgi:hypothetical protein
MSRQKAPQGSNTHHHQTIIGGETSHVFLLFLDRSCKTPPKIGSRAILIVTSTVNILILAEMEHYTVHRIGKVVSLSLLLGF